MSDAFCIYSPVIIATLYQLVEQYDVNLVIKKALFRDYIRGLSYLHDEKKIMHRDINPNNLGILSLGDPKGIIIDLDSATDSPTSINHMYGTIPFLAPEVIALKQWRPDGSLSQSEQQPPPYERSVDIWALGLSMVVLLQEKPLSWANLKLLVSRETGSRLATCKDDWVTPEVFKRLKERISERLIFEEERAFLLCILQMIRYESQHRIVATELLTSVLSWEEDQEQNRIIESSKGKRKLRS